MPDISFCIPTYNFAKFLTATLDSIIKQADENIEIVIVDGGSTDETDEIIQTYQKKFPQLVFFKRDKNCGVDRDIVKTVKLAKGDFCWLFSADDILKPGAINKMRELIAIGGWNALITNFTICDYHMNPLTKHQIFYPSEDFKADWNIPQQRKMHLSRAITSTAFFSYISSVVVSRQDWLDAGPCEEYLGSCWIIAAKVMMMSRRHLSVYYYDGELLRKRGGNDSFLSRGICWRIKLALHDFPSISETIFGNKTAEHQAFKRVTKNEFSIFSILGFKAQLPKDRKEIKRFNEVVRRYWIRSFKDALLFYIIRILPTPMLLYLKTWTKKKPVLFRFLKKIG
jgi:abequosyltransferase